MNEQPRTAAGRCPIHPGTCQLFAAAGWCAHTQELDGIRRRVERWLVRPGRTGDPSDAAADRAWLLDAVTALSEGAATGAKPDLLDAALDLLDTFDAASEEYVHRDWPVVKRFRRALAASKEERP